MLTLNKLHNLAFALVALVALFALALAFSQTARADAIVFLTRIGGVQTTYPRSNAFSVGTTSSSVAKLSVYANTGETNTRLFEVASSSSAGATGILLRVDNKGCMQMAPTSTATTIKLNFLTVATTSANGFVTWSYGSCL